MLPNCHNNKPNSKIRLQYPQLQISKISPSIKAAYILLTTTHLKARAKKILQFRPLSKALSYSLVELYR